MFTALRFLRFSRYPFLTPAQPVCVGCWSSCTAVCWHRVPVWSPWNWLFWPTACVCHALSPSQVLHLLEYLVLKTTLVTQHGVDSAPSLLKQFGSQCKIVDYTDLRVHDWEIKMCARTITIIISEHDYVHCVHLQNSTLWMSFSSWQWRESTLMDRCWRTSSLHRSVPAKMSWTI